MPTASPAITAFNGGEFSPLLDGRIDFQKYPNGCKLLDNYVLTTQGPLKQRPGTRFVSEVKDSSKRVWLARFEFNVANAYILEFGDQYIRFYTQNGRLESPPGTPVEVSTPYLYADLFETSGACRLRVAQSGDFLYIAHEEYEPMVLSRTSATSFSLAQYRPVGGPFNDLNDNRNVFLNYTGVVTPGGTGTIVCNAGIFQPGHVGELFLIESVDFSSIRPWEPLQNMTVGEYRRVGNRVYRCTQIGEPDSAGHDRVTGSITPTHTSGRAWDGDGKNKNYDGDIAGIGVEWEFLHASYGWVRVTGFINSGSVTATVVSRLPDDVTTSNTWRWAHGAWSAVQGWPSQVAFFRERLVMAGGQKLWFSVASDFNDFSARTDGGEIAADQAINVTLSSGELNAIQWLLPDRDLLAGTAAGEFSIGELTNGQPIGPGNIRSRLQSQYGSVAVVPVHAGGAVLFLQRSARKLREISYDFATDGYQSTDQTALAEHITKYGLIDLDYAQEPDGIVWGTRADGLLIGFTRQVEQNVWGWHRHNLGGQGVLVESVAVAPSPDQARNQVWLCVSRTIGGVTKRYVEFIEKSWDADEDEQSGAFYVDCGLTYSGAPASTISGLGHLEGQTVAVLADGAPHPQRVVSSGSISLQSAASVVQVGLPYRARVQTMRIEAGSSNGTAQGKIKRIHKVIVRLDNTSSGRFGGDFNRMDEITFRNPNDPMDRPVPPFTGDKDLSWPNGYDRDGYVCFENDKPLPSTVVAFFPQVSTSDSV